MNLTSLPHLPITMYKALVTPCNFTSLLLPHQSHFFFLNDPPPPKLPPLPLPDALPIPPQRQAFTDSAQKKPVPPQLRETRDLVAQALATPGEPDQRG